MELKRVVVTGLGALTPIGNTKDEYWNIDLHIGRYRSEMVLSGLGNWLLC